LRIAFIAFLALLFLAPIPYALVPPLPQAAALTAIWVLVVWTAIVRWMSGADSGLRSVRWEAAALVVLAAWICVQMLPLGGSLAHPLWAELPVWLGRDLGGSISLSPELTFEALMRLLAYGGLFWLVLQFGQDRRQAMIILAVVVATGWLNALYGIVNYILGNETVLLASRVAYTDDVTGTFVNRNSAAAFFGLCLLPGVAYLAGALLTSSRSSRGRSRSERISALQRKLERAFLGIAVLAVPGSALLMSPSRAGTLSVVAAVVIVLALTAATTAKGSRGTWIAVAGLGLVILVGIIFGSERLASRLEAGGLSLDDRAVAYQALWRAIQDSPFLGFGFGSFERSFYLYMPASLSTLFDRAHNDWLEGVAGLGWIGALLLNAILASLTVRSLFGVFRRRRDRLFCIAAVAASLQLAIHSFVDFSLQIPAVTFVFIVLLALGVAQSSSSRAHHHDAE